MTLEEDIQKTIKKIQIEIVEQREEILTAFLAKWGMNPEDCEQVVDFSDYQNGTIRWSVRRKKIKNEA